jgi:exosome complex exonuclease DIS3/RRP44
MFKKDMEFDPNAYTVTLPSPQGPVTVAVFDKVQVNITVETDKNTQRGKVHMTLAPPVDSRDVKRP